MAKLFSVASWNVEHFNKGIDAANQERVRRVIGFLKEQNPDVFALYEVEGGDAFRELFSQMPNYTFHITEGEQVQQILVGVRSHFSAFFTQKLEFKSGVPELRPGALLTLFINGQYYPLLFLHTKSGADPRGFGLRDDILGRSIRFRKVLEGNGPPIPYLILGDLNTMGLEYPQGHSITADEEIKRIAIYAKRYYDMTMLTKTSEATWSNGSTSSIPPSKLDHVLAAEHLRFSTFPAPDGSLKQVDVRGWAKLATPAEQDQWIKEYSDHCLLYFEVLEG